MNKQFNVNIMKTDQQQRTATGLVFAPNKIDSQGDFMTPEGVRTASEKFMKSGRTGAIDVGHNGVFIDAFVSENVIDKNGAWVATVKVNDPDVWKSVADGSLTGFSMYGAGSRTQKTLDGKAASLLSGVEISAISLVKRGANGASFSVLKSDEQAMLDMHLPELAKLAKSLEAVAEQSQANTDLLAGIASTPPSAEAVQVAEAAQVSKLQREHDVLSERLFELQPGTPAYAIAHDRYQNRILDVEIELDMFSKGDDLAPHDAFFQTGGSSTFLRASISDNAFGQRSVELRKAENEISLADNGLSTLTDEAEVAKVDLGFEI